MRILVACEYSGRVRDAFIAAGHDAISCDLLPSDVPGPHIQGDVRGVLAGSWDMVLAFPPCTDLASSGAPLPRQARRRTATEVNRVFSAVHPALLPLGD